jgi:hypothetical protein
MEEDQDYVEAILLVLKAQSLSLENGYRTTHEQETQNVVVLHFARSAVLHSCPTEKQWAT